MSVNKYIDHLDHTREMAPDVIHNGLHSIAVIFLSKNVLISEKMVVLLSLSFGLGFITFLMSSGCQSIKNKCLREKATSTGWMQKSSKN